MAIREYRSNMFSMLLKEPHYALEVYNALNDSNYDNVDDIEIFCLENGISLSIRNDASFLLHDNLNIYEHQSSLNPNMPVRDLIYFTELLKELIEKKEADILGHKLVCIPNPKFVVFYNGIEDYPEVKELHLSDSYINHEDSPMLELKCTVYNINPTKNEELKKKSTMLAYYTEFVESVKKRGPFGRDKNKLRKALETVIADFIRNDKLKDFLLKHGDEVIEMATLDFTFERREELIKREYFNDGLSQGLTKGCVISLLDIIIKKVKKQKSLETIADEAEEEIDYIRPMYETIIANPKKNSEEIYNMLMDEK